MASMKVGSNRFCCYCFRFDRRVPLEVQGSHHIDGKLGEKWNWSLLNHLEKLERGVQ